MTKSRNRRANTSSQSIGCLKPSKRIAVISLKLQNLFFFFPERNKVMKMEKPWKGFWNYKPHNVGFALGLVFVHVIDSSNVTKHTPCPEWISSHRTLQKHSNQGLKFYIVRCLPFYSLPLHTHTSLPVSSANVPGKKLWQTKLKVL